LVSDFPSRRSNNGHLSTGPGREGYPRDIREVFVTRAALTPFLRPNLMG
jgi:hypothetical protein